MGTTYYVIYGKRGKWRTFKNKIEAIKFAMKHTPYMGYQTAVYLKYGYRKGKKPAIVETASRILKASTVKELAKKKVRTHRKRTKRTTTGLLSLF